MYINSTYISAINYDINIKSQKDCGSRSQVDPDISTQFDWGFVFIYIHDCQKIFYR